MDKIDTTTQLTCFHFIYKVKDWFRDSDVLADRLTDQSTDHLTYATS